MYYLGHYKAFLQADKKYFIAKVVQMNWLNQHRQILLKKVCTGIQKSYLCNPNRDVA
jgi:hypothetical protein